MYKFYQIISFSIIFSYGSAAYSNHDFTEGPVVDIHCKSKVEGRYKSAADITITEVGRVNVEEALDFGVPETFMKFPVKEGYFIRKFIVNGKVMTTYPDKHVEILKDAVYFGNLSFPSTERSIRRTSIYTNYGNDPFIRAISFNRNDREPGEQADLNPRVSVDNHMRVECSGTIPKTESVGDFQPIGKPWHRNFSCELKARGEATDIKFRFQLTNLHHERFLSPVVHGGEESHQVVLAEKIENHVLTYVNGPDGYVRKGDGNRLFIYGDSDGVEFGKIDLDYPAITDTEINGKYFYKGPDHLRTRWAKVKCNLSEYEKN